MSLLSGKSSISVFTVHGEISPELDMAQFILERTNALSFKDIDDTYDEYSCGWVSVIDMFNSNIIPVVGDYVIMSVRIDERKVAAAVLKKFVSKEEHRIKEERQIPKLARAAKLEIKERVKLELVRKAKPSPQVFDVVWNLADHTVFFFSTNQKAKAIFEDIFKETFGLMSKQKIPSTICSRFFGDDFMNSISPIQLA